LSRRIGVGGIFLKDESSRFGISSFKALGGAYAVLRLVSGALGVNPKRLTAAHLREERALLNRISAMTVVCATDGNHGRAVAWGARLVGCRAVIYIHARVSAGREEALRALGADVRRSSGNYDDAVREAAKASREHGWFSVADTAVDESDASPRLVMEGYTLLMTETAKQLQQPPTHVIVQAGVGALAAAVTAGAQHYWSDHAPRIVVVEPTQADCVRRSIEAGHPKAVPGSLDTVMAGLACGEVSHWAWPVLRSAITHAIAIPDAQIGPTMRLIYHGVNSDPRLTLIGTEGITDPAIYKSLVPEWSGA
jgi:diaminopropionate ammonia-lyase